MNPAYRSRIPSCVPRSFGTANVGCFLNRVIFVFCQRLPPPLEAIESHPKNGSRKGGRALQTAHAPHVEERTDQARCPVFPFPSLVPPNFCCAPFCLSHSPLSFAHRVYVWLCGVCRRRQLKSTLFEIIIPTFFFALMMVIKCTTHTAPHPQSHTPQRDRQDTRQRHRKPESQRVASTCMRLLTVVSVPSSFSAQIPFITQVTQSKQHTAEATHVYISLYL